jgi:PAS domain S-box-containing protein
VEGESPGLDAEERQLSDRERTVLLLAAEGLTDKEIAKHLNLSQRTIGTYWERMRQKLGPFSRTQLVARFLRLEAEIERSNENYRNVFAGWDEGVWIVSATGRTVYANQPVASLLGLDLDELVAADGPSTLRKVIGSQGDEFLQTASTTGTVTEAAVSPDRWISLKGSPVKDRRGQASATVLIVRDLTFHKRVRQTLDSCQQSLQYVAEHTGDPAVRFSADLICLYVNPACEEFVKAPARSIVGRHIAEIEPFNPVEIWQKAVQDALASGGATTAKVCWDGAETQRLTHVIPEPAPEFQPTSVLCLCSKAKV